MLLIQCTNSDRKDIQYISIQEGGIVPNEKAAKRIAEAILISTYGKFVIEEKPYRAILKGDSLWIVEGTLSKKNWEVSFI